MEERLQLDVKAYKPLLLYNGLEKSILRKIRASKYRSGAQVMVFGMSVDGGFCPIVLLCRRQ